MSRFLWTYDTLLQNSSHPLSIHPYFKVRCKFWGQGITLKIWQNSSCSKSWHFNVCFHPTLEQRAEMSRLFLWVEILGKKNPKKPQKLFSFSGKVTSFCLTFSSKTKYFAIPEIKMFSCGVSNWPQNALFQVTSELFPLYYSLLGHVVWKFALCSLHVWIVWKLWKPI